MPHTDADATGLQFIANNTKLGIFTYEVEANRFTYLNPAFEQACKMTKESADPGFLLGMIHPEDQQYVTEAYRKLLEGEGGREIEFRITLPEQEERWVCLRPFLSGGMPGQQRIAGYVEDVTALKQYTDYLKKFTSKKDSVLHILAHDLAGPLSMIQGLSGLLSETATPYENQKLNELIGLIGKTSANAVALIKNLTNHEFLETTGVDFIKQRVEMVSIFEEAMVQYRKSEKEINKTFRFVASGEKIYAELDDTKFMQAVNNLVSNAIKFTPEGGIITVSLEEKEDTVLAKVEDNGVGIPEKYHATLFDKFTNARRPGLDGEPSTGLGMSIIKTIVEWHRGQIWFESEEGKGTTFYIELPKA